MSRDGGRRGDLARRLGVVLALLLLGASLAYVLSNQQRLEGLERLDAATLAAAWATVLLSIAASARLFQLVLARVGTRAGFGDMLLLQNASTVLALFPLKGGSVLRALYLRQRYGLDVGRLGVFFAFLLLLSIGVTAALAAAVLATTGDGLAGRRGALAALLAVMALGALLAAVVPPPERLRRRLPIVARLDDLRRSATTHLGDWVRPAGWVVVQFAVAAVRIAVLYRGLGIGLTAPEALVLAALGNAAMMVAVTPAALGVRELVLGGGAVALGLSMEVGLLVALIERAVVLAWALVVGLPATVVVFGRLRRRDLREE
jgi:uncharacterized membrane protein YbhN (UPF0104 family)